MDPTLEFAISGLVEFSANLAANRDSIPNALFIDIITEKCSVIRDHI